MSEWEGSGTGSWSCWRTYVVDFTVLAETSKGLAMLWMLAIFE